MSTPINTIVLGGTGYVAGELLRLIAGHPQLKLVAALSESQAGVQIGEVFPHLQDVFEEQCYVARDQISEYLQGQVALFSAAPHGASAPMIAEIIAAAAERNCKLTVVDASADFRFASATGWEQVYGQAHGAPGADRAVRQRAARACRQH